MLALVVSLSCLGQTATTPDPKTEIYREVRSALIEVNNQAARKDLSVRQAFKAREGEAAKKRVEQKHQLTRPQLDAIIIEGEKADGTAKRKAELAAKNAAKARQKAQIEAMTTPPPTLPPGLSRADRSAAIRAMQKPR